MDDYLVTLPIPASVYDHARRTAEQTARPIEQVLVEYLEAAASESQDEPLPADEQAELDALARLSDDALWTIAREQMPLAAQARMQVLMDRNSRGQLSEAERQELEELVERGDRLTLRKAEAAALLTERGYKVTPSDLAARNE
jgi:hypothetical protein